MLWKTIGGKQGKSPKHCAPGIQGSESESSPIPPQILSQMAKLVSGAPLPTQKKTGRCFLDIFSTHNMSDLNVKRLQKE